MDKGGEVGLSKEGQRVFRAGLEGSRVPDRSSGPSGHLGPSLKKSRPRKDRHRLSATQQAGGRAGARTQVCRPHPRPVGKNGEITMSFRP